ncbi:geranylgeranylglycerol-phosphate geranylgeranyltransferase [Echinicola vietnamensis]|uniref:4-hydroxybenzoate polyprenyltransferase-like prenyltransferase n=1 Tax=Echinicola vietnamensis (strain DSM 17526 / LMG 23754 / KMM 6221) TaxID=926556 RepID=L0FWQ4_ECHVK|nr:geranylgeranylglycerol-phosphate geranylgeranyltransferase [Echinicola vietnamensis]AGA77737.1 4-hydroxybenzoate polyprenyltransferase-like prenyltransferase [Echinicola vietnamensis DSM 17526]
MNHSPSAEKAFSFTAFLRIIRTDNLLMMAFAQLMTAYFLVEETQTGTPALLDPKIYLLITSTILIAASGYLINDYYDVKIDYINKPDEVVIGKGMRRRVVMFLHTFFNLVGIGLACLVSLKVGAIHFIAAILLWMYSNSLKRLPFVGNLAVALLTALAIWIVGFYYQQSALVVLAYAIFAFFINLIREIIKDIEDREGDRKHGCKTLPVVLGFRATKNIIFIIATVFVTSIIVVAYKIDQPLLYLYFGLIGLLFLYFMYLIYQADRKSHFTRLSKLSKILMLTGVMSMAFL